MFWRAIHLSRLVLGCFFVPQQPIILIKCSFLIPPALAGWHSSSCTNQCGFYICAFRLTGPWFKQHCQEHLVNRQHFMCYHKKMNKSPNEKISNVPEWVFLTLGDQTFSTLKWEQQHQKYSNAPVYVSRDSSLRCTPACWREAEGSKQCKLNEEDNVWLGSEASGSKFKTGATTWQSVGPLERSSKCD